MDLLSWTQKQAAKASVKFSDTEKVHAVSFIDLMSFCDGEEHEISEGVKIKAQIVSEYEIFINCKMQKGAILSEHYHPDYTETFNILKGKMYDIVSGVTLTPHNYSFPFWPNVSHEPQAIEYTELTIKCTKTEIHE